MAVLPSTLTDMHCQAPMQLRMEADVRRLLRRASNPYQLAALPLAQALCEATGILNAQAALQHVIESAFHESPQEARFRDLLLSSEAEAATCDRNERWFQVSKRHLQRRRAKAVSVLAQHVRKLVGGPQLVVVEDRNGGAVDPLETLAELVSSIEPATASRIFGLGGLESNVDAAMLTIRGQIDVGHEIGEMNAGLPRDISPPLAAVLNAQARQISGTHAAAKRELWPLLKQAERDSNDDSEVRFELEWLAFLRACHGGDARQMERVAINLRRIAHGRAVWLLRALLAQADAEIRRGRIEHAAALLDETERRSLRNFALVQLASASALRAEIALQIGDDASAERLASGAYFVLRGRHFDAYRCQVTIARAALRRGKPWAYPEDLGNLAPSSWDRAALEVERARGLVGAGNIESARRCAGDAFRTAVELKYDGLAARAAAALGATFNRRRRQRRDWYLRALSYLLDTRDRLAGCDLFGVARERDDSFSAQLLEAIPEVLYDRLTSAVPQLRVQSERESALARAFLKSLSLYVLGYGLDTARLQDAIEALDAGAPFFAQYALHFLEDATDIFATLFAAVAARGQQAEVGDRLTGALQSFVAGVRRREHCRSFLVG
jgi:hypothetical protein